MSTRSGGNRGVNTAARVSEGRRRYAGKGLTPRGTRATLRARTTRPLRQQTEGARPRLVESSRGTQEKLTLTRAEQADYKELKAKAGAYEKQERVYAKLQARAVARGDTEGEKFYRLMSGAARSQLRVLAEYDRKREALKGQRAQMRAAADAKKTQQMLGGKAPKPTAPAGSAVAWARANPDEVGRERSRLDEPVREDTALTKIAHEMGYAVQPWTATRSQMDRMVDELGAHEFFRGFSSRVQSGTLAEAVARGKGYARDFAKGPYRSGFGTYGSGYYVGGNGEGARGTAHYYAQSGVVVRGAIIPGARFAGFGETKKAMQTEGNAFLRAHGITPTLKPNANFGSHDMHHGPDPASRALSPADRGEYTLRYGDVGRYAASKGIDVLGDTRGGYWVILNRGVMVVQRGAEKFSARVMDRNETSTPRRKKKAG